MACMNGQAWHFKRFFLLFLAALIFSQAAFLPEANATDEPWQYIGDYEGVALYRSSEEADGLLPFKAEAEVAVAHDKIIMALIDAVRKPDWAPKLKAAKIHSRPDTNSFEVSEYYETPWPFKDREFLIFGTVTYKHDRVEFSAVNSENLHLASKDHIRADIKVLDLTVIPLSKDRSRLIFTFSGDMGGWIPGFVRNIIQKKWPVLFIQALANYIDTNDSLETEQYRALDKSGLEMPVQESQE